MTLGERLRQVRQERGLSQAQTAGDCMTRNMLSQLENDQAQPSVKSLMHLSKVLGVSVGWLLGEETGACSDPVMQQAKAYFHDGQFLKCVELLGGSERQPDDEQGLLLFRSALCAAEQLMKETRFSSADSLLCAVEQVRSLYIDREDLKKWRILKLRCVLAAGETDEALLRSLCEMCREDPLPELIARHELVKGKVHVQNGLYAQALPHLHRVEDADILRGRELRELYRLLEQCGRELEDYKTAYQYAKLLSVEV